MMSGTNPALIPGALYGDDFGFGAGEFASVEGGLVMFLLGLLCGVFLLGGLFVFLIRREKRQVPEETEQLLREFEDEGDDFGVKPSLREPERREAWERDGDWWKSG